MADQPILPAEAWPGAMPRFGGAGMLAMTLLAGFLLLCVGASALPDDRYIRYQQLAPTIQFRAIWAEERMRDDRTPIDIAIIGVSRTAAGISAPVLSQRLSAALGRPIHVANLAMPQEGRNAQYAIAKELFATHPEVRLVIAARTEREGRQGHPAFRSIADRADLTGAPVLLNAAWLDDIAYLPWRQSALLVQNLAPGLFGTEAHFDPAHYAGADFDTTASYRNPLGTLIDRDSLIPAATLRDQARRLADHTPRLLPDRFGDYEYAIERGYLRRIAALAQRNGTRMAFLYLPYFEGPRVPEPDPLYDPIGQTIGFGDLANDPNNFSDYGHFNRNGTRQATERLAAILIRAMQQEHAR